MSAPKRRCACRMPVAGCVCDDDPADVRDDLPRDCGPLIRLMMGGGDPEPGPPYTHVHRLPVEDEEAPYAPPDPPFTIVVRATKRGTCRYCGSAITHGPKGWRDNEDGPLAYGCAEAALGFHEPAVVV